MKIRYILLAGFAWYLVWNWMELERKAAYASCVKAKIQSNETCEAYLR